MNGHTLIGATPASTPGMPLIYAQSSGALHDLNPNASSASPQYIGAFLGNGFSINGNYVPTDPYFGAIPVGGVDSGAAISTTIAAAIYNTQTALSSTTSATTNLPAGTYLIDQPILLPSTQLSGLSTNAAPVQLFGASKYATVLQNGMIGGPILVPMSGWAIASANNGNPIKQAALVTGSSGSAQWASNGSGEWSFVLQELLGAQFMNGQAQADVRGFYNPSNSAGSIEILSSSMGALSKWNCTVDGTLNECEGAWAAYRNASGNLVCQFNLSTSGLIKATSAGTFTQNAVNEWECSYNGADVYAILKGTASAGVAGTGTIVQGEFETSLIGGGVSMWPLIEWGQWPAGKVDSVEIANVARNTTNYTQHTAAYTGDTHSIVLFPGFGTNLNMPANLVPAGTWPWAFGPSYLNGTAINETSNHAWVEAKTTGIGCCGSEIQIANLKIEGGMEGITSQVARLTVQHVDLEQQTYIGGETTNSSYGSKWSDIDSNAYNGVGLAAANLVVCGGDSSVTGAFLNDAGYLGVWLEQATLRDSYLTSGAGSLADIVMDAGGLAEGNDEDNEGGGTFHGFDFTSDPQQIARVFRIVANSVNPQGSGEAPFASYCNNNDNQPITIQDNNIGGSSPTTELDSTHCAPAAGLGIVDFEGNKYNNSAVLPSGTTYTNNNRVFRARDSVNIPARLYHLEFANA